MSLLEKIVNLLIWLSSVKGCLKIHNFGQILKKYQGFLKQKQSFPNKLVTVARIGLEVKNTPKDAKMRGKNIRDKASLF